MSNKKLTITEVRKIALANYNRGGDIIVECWTDGDILEWIANGGNRKSLKNLFATWNDAQRIGAEV